MKSDPYLCGSDSAPYRSTIKTIHKGDFYHGNGREEHRRRA